jgi:monoamine oxidase
MQTEELIDVLIVGAGATGLVAWRELHSAGLRVGLLEARNRLGGRILTDRSALPPVELGAEFVHGKPEATWSILEKAHLPVVETSRTRIVSGRDHPNQNYEEIIERVHRQINPTHEISYQEFLETANASPFEKLVAKSYVEGFNAAQADLISASAVVAGDQATTRNDGKKQYRLTGGYESLINWLAKHLPADSLHLQTEVREIRWQRGRVDVIANSSGGKQTFSAQRLIVTVPISLLQAPEDLQGAIRFFPLLPQKEAALRQLAMGHVVKLVICFKERFWETKGRFGFVHSLGDNIPTWWTQEPLLSNCLTGWSGGSVAHKLIDLSAEELLDRAIDSLGRIFERSKHGLKECIDQMYYHNWSHDPFSRGAYSYPKIDGLKAARFLAEPVDDTVFLAGEATNFEGDGGTVHAALKSGVSTARKVATTFSKQIGG